MVGLEFGLFDTLPRAMKASRHVTGDVADVFLDKISNAQCAESLGYKYLFFIEHQNSAFPAITSSNVYLAALAQATKSIRLGVMVFQLPMQVLSMPHALARKSIEMFGREVIPNFAQLQLAVAE